MTFNTVFLGYDAFIPHFKADVFVLKYLGTVIFVFNVVLWRFLKGTRRIKASEVDLFTGRRQFEEMESAQDVQGSEGFWKKTVVKVRAWALKG